MEQLLTLLKVIAYMSPGLETHLRKILQYQQFKKGDIILKAGEISSHIYFLESGLVRIFHLCKDKEANTWFLKEGDIFISVFAFFEQRPSYETIEALEDCACWCISFEQLKEACELYPEFDKHEKLILRKYYTRSEERRFKMQLQEPEERYAILMEEEPWLLQRAPLNLLPSYLDMSERTFNRVRNNYSFLKSKGK